MSYRFEPHPWLVPISETQYTIGALGRRSRCLCGKARYATEREAGRDAKRMRYKGRGHGYKGLLRPYQCPERKGIWHVGHTDE